jgi:hypothetical protein
MDAQLASEVAFPSVTPSMWLPVRLCSICNPSLQDTLCFLYRPFVHRHLDYFQFVSLAAPRGHCVLLRTAWVPVVSLSSSRSVRTAGSPPRLVRPTLDGTPSLKRRVLSCLTYVSSFGTVPADRHQELMGKRGCDYVLPYFCCVLFLWLCGDGDETEECYLT